MDNCAIHKVNTADIVREAGHVLHYAQPYSPECNPIENCFGFWKRKVEDIKP